jgi:Flp pilus assembly protein TadD
MSRENILFAVVGVLAGYIVAFHLVVYVNQSEGAPRGGAGQAASAGLPDDHPSLPTNEVKERQRLQSEAEAAAQAAREAPQDFDAQARAAAASLNAGQFEEAVDFLTRANQLRPGDYDTLVRLGNANFEARRFDVAERWYKEALSKKPEDPDVRSDLGLTYFLREPPQTDRAIAEFRRALDADPQHLFALHNLTFALTKARDFEAAEASLAKLERINPTGDNLPVLREELQKARREAGAGQQKRAPTD